MKIILISPYSNPSKCGIWKRVSQDIEVLRDNHEIISFSSNIKKGTSEKLSLESDYKGIKIFRFPVRFKLGGTSMFFFFWKKLGELNPDVINVHGYRHPHCLQALLWAKLNKKKIIITTHGPFKKDPRRSMLLKIIDNLYDLLIGWWELRLYDQIITVASWEVPFLIKRNAPKSKIAVVPNSIDNEFIENKPEIKEPPFVNVLYMGRVEKVKRVDWIIEIAKKLPKYNFTIFGEHQDNSLKDLVIPENVQIIDRSYEGSAEFIEECKKNDIFIFPSIRESFGIVGLEAMSQGLLLLSSDTYGIKEFLKDGENGYIFKDIDKAVSILKEINVDPDRTIEMMKKGIKTVSNYALDKNGEKLIEVYKSEIINSNV